MRKKIVYDFLKTIYQNFIKEEKHELKQKTCIYEHLVCIFTNRQMLAALKKILCAIPDPTFAQGNVECR